MSWSGGSLQDSVWYPRSQIMTLESGMQKNKAAQNASYWKVVWILYYIHAENYCHLRLLSPGSSQRFANIPGILLKNYKIIHFKPRCEIFKHKDCFLLFVHCFMNFWFLSLSLAHSKHSISIRWLETWRNYCPKEGNFFLNADRMWTRK